MFLFSIAKYLTLDNYYILSPNIPSGYRIQAIKIMLVYRLLTSTDDCFLQEAVLTLLYLPFDRSRRTIHIWTYTGVSWWMFGHI